MNWLGISVLGVTIFIMGIATAYGVSNILIFVFIVVHAVIAILVLRRISHNISSRQIPENKKRKNRYAGLWAALAAVLVFSVSIFYTKPQEVLAVIPKK